MGACLGACCACSPREIEYDSTKLKTISPDENKTGLIDKKKLEYPYKPLSPKKRWIHGYNQEGLKVKNVVLIINMFSGGGRGAKIYQSLRLCYLKTH
eukprot:UN17818